MSRAPKKSPTNKATTVKPRISITNKGAGQGLMIQAPPETLKALRVSAAARGTTVRALVLDALAQSGYPVPPNELVDRRR
jgi:hypothetical protein